MRIFLVGQGFFAAQVAGELTVAGHRVLGAASPRLRDGHNDKEDPRSWDRLRAWAHRAAANWTDSTVLRPDEVPEDTELIVAAHAHAFIGAAARRRARVAAIGYHPSLLPLHRGRDAVRWTVRDRDRVTGGTVYHLTDRVDAGPVAAQEHVLVPPTVTARGLWRDLLAPLGVRLLLRVADDLANGVRIEEPQDESLATWEPAMSVPPLARDLTVVGPTRR
ncbi:MAG TPA: formyltransferase family protein [Pseudonocardiaceae bacterium]|nr:formyltransferase family protein [Pseudonocardiaceae bacterium]